MIRWLTALGLLAGCTVAPSERLTWRETWEVVALADSGTFFHGRLVRGNTGVLRGEGHLVLDVLPVNESPVQLHRRSVGAGVEHGDLGARVASDVLEVGSDLVSLVVREGGDALDATLRLRPVADAVSPVALVEGERQWLAGVPVALAELDGAWRAGEQGGLVDGRGLVLRQATDTWPSGRRERTLLLVFYPGGVVGVDTVGGSALTWMASAGTVSSGRSARVERRGRRLQVSLAPDLPVEVTLRLKGASLVSRPWEHLTFLEKPLVGLAVGLPEQRLSRGAATLSVGDTEHPGQALLVSTAGRHEAPEQPRRLRRKARSR